MLPEQACGPCCVPVQSLFVASLTMKAWPSHCPLGWGVTLLARSVTTPLPVEGGFVPGLNTARIRALSRVAVDFLADPFVRIPRGSLPLPRAYPSTPAALLLLATCAVCPPSCPGRSCGKVRAGPSRRELADATLLGRSQETHLHPSHLCSLFPGLPSLWWVLWKGLYVIEVGVSPGRGSRRSPEVEGIMQIFSGG